MWSWKASTGPKQTRLSTIYLDRESHTGVAVQRLEQATEQIGAADLKVPGLGIGNHGRRLAIVGPAHHFKVVLCRTLCAAQ